MEAERRKILQQVRDGSISPEEALRLLEGPSDEVPRQPRSRDEGEGRQPIGRLRIDHALGRVTVRGNPSVARFSVSGPHYVREEGRSVVIEGEPNPGVGFVMGPGERRPHWRWPGKGRQGSTLTVDINPSVPIDAVVQAGALRVMGIKAPIKGHVDLGTVTVEDCDGPVDLRVESGTIRVDGVVTGRSSISCELGKVIANLDPASDVRVTAHCSLGSVSLGETDGARQKRAGVGSLGEFEIGSGAGDLDIRVECGTIKVGVDR